jgi:glycerophosphoryl diester phosphodiesterase
MRDAGPRILAHRGASGHRPENSLDAFREALRLGADGVELDVHTTADGALLVRHDGDIPGLGPIHSLSLRFIRESLTSPAAPFPTLAEALQVMEGLEVWVELKGLPPHADDALLATLAAAPAPERCAVHSFDHRIVARLGARLPGLRRGILSTSYPVDPVGPMLAAGARTLWQEWPLIDAELVAAVHRTGGQIIAWTVNDADHARRLAALGVDALCGNYPERLRCR